MLNCELQEMRSTSAYYTWTNKTIWTRIDRAFHNCYWYSNFNYTHVRYMASSLSDHSPILISFPTTHKPKSRFQFCDIWSKHPEFHSIIQQAIPPIHGPASKQLELFLSNMRLRLTQLNKNSYADLHEQKAKAKNTLEAIQQQMIEDRGNFILQQQEKEARSHYINILSSVMDLLRQQNKIEWIKYGDNCTRLFFAKAKQRKLATYVYAINDDEGLQVEGFENVGKVMLNFYNKLLGKAFTLRTESTRRSSRQALFSH